MKGKRRILASSLDNLGILNLLSRVNRPLFIVLNFHRLYRGRLTTEFDEGIFGHSEDAFVAHLGWLQSKFDIIDETTLMHRIENKIPFNQRTAMLTFDDGYRDNYEIAYPILAEKKIPATFFIACNLVNGTALAWWDQIAFMIKNSRKREVTFNGTTVTAGEAITSYEGSVRNMLLEFKKIPMQQLDEALNALAQCCEVPVPVGDDIKSQFMTWEQVREVSRNGITIGSHSMSHRILGLLPQDQQRWELEESKRVLESETGQTINSVAYPVGGPTSFQQQTIDIAKECGYRLGFSFIENYYDSALDDEFRICRIVSDPLVPIFKAQTTLPTVYIKRQQAALLPNP